VAALVALVAAALAELLAEVALVAAELAEVNADDADVAALVALVAAELADVKALDALVAALVALVAALVAEVAAEVALDAAAVALLAALVALVAALVALIAADAADEAAAVASPRIASTYDFGVADEVDIPTLDRPVITGEPEMVGKGNLYELFSPFKVSEGKFNQAKAVLVAYGVPMYIPKKSFDGIQLSATQYNRWIELATQDGMLAERIATLGESDALQSLAANNLEAAQAIISKEISDSYSRAKQMLIAEDPDLFDMVREADEFKRDYGKYKR